MARRRFRWTRKLYQEADSLARFLGRHMYELPDAPPLVQRYLRLWERHPQRSGVLHPLPPLRAASSSRWLIRLLMLLPNNH